MRNELTSFCNDFGTLRTLQFSVRGYSRLMVHVQVTQDSLVAALIFPIAAATGRWIFKTFDFLQFFVAVQINLY